MLADDAPCNPRNPRPGTVFNSKNQQINVYGDDVEVDYRGYDVTVENLIRLLTGRHREGTPRNKRLMSDDGSNIFVYMTGHGGEGFLKFQDNEEITNKELADAFQQMWEKKRYNEIFYMIDSCQASSMYDLFYSPNILATSSSLVGEDSYSHQHDSSIGVHVIDRYTYHVLEFMERVERSSTRKMSELFKCCPRNKCGSTVGVRSDLFPRKPSQTLVMDFFGGSRTCEVRDTVKLTNFLDEDATIESVEIKNEIVFNKVSQFPF